MRQVWGYKRSLDNVEGWLIGVRIVEVHYLPFSLIEFVLQCFEFRLESHYGDILLCGGHTLVSVLLLLCTQ